MSQSQHGLSLANYSVNVVKDSYDMYKLADAATNSLVTLCPERGGIAVSCRLHGEELFYLDQATLLDPSANIRGGNPVLFPNAGQLIDGQYEWGGRTYVMKNHGVARNRPWRVIETGTEGDSSAFATLALRSDQSTLEEFPFDFELRFTYRLRDGVLVIEQQYTNLSKDKAMPMVTGFHPYFAVEGKNLSYDTDATKALDYNDGMVKTFGGSYDLAGKVESTALLDLKRREIAFPLREGQKVRMTFSEPFRYVVLWSVEGKPFVCVEPWTALNEALNRREGLLFVQPGDSLKLELAIGLEKHG